MSIGWNKAKAIHVILPDGETAGPYSVGDIEAMLEEETIQPESFAFCEGMPDWRSIAETMVWAHRELAQLVRPELEEQMQLLLDAKINDATARLALREALKKKGIWPSDTEIHAVELILDANTCLRRRYDNFSNDFAAGALDAFPAAELRPLTKLEFKRDWTEAWKKAGGRVYDGERLIARRDDFIWVKLSDFGYPFPPFSFERWMDTQIVSWKEAVDLGVISKADEVRPPSLMDEFIMVAMHF